MIVIELIGNGDQLFVPRGPLAFHVATDEEDGRAAWVEGKQDAYVAAARLTCF